MDFIQILLSIYIGYLFGNAIGGKQAGERGLIHWEWFIGKTKIHLHHWFIMLIILMLYLMFIGNNEVIIGFLIGGISQGLSYDDWYKFIV